MPLVAGTCCPKNIQGCEDVWHATEATLYRKHNEKTRPVKDRLALLYKFIRRIGGWATDDPRVAIKDRTPEDAVKTYSEMCLAYHWNSEHNIRANKKYLASALLVLPNGCGASLATALHSDYCQTSAASKVVVHNPDSHRTSFTIHECLSAKLRKECGPDHPHYLLIGDLMGDMLIKLKSASHHHLSQIANFFCVLWLGHQTKEGEPIWHPQTPSTSKEMRRLIREIPIGTVLKHYEDVTKNKITPDHFNRQARWINIAHCQILHNVPVSQQLRIPKGSWFVTVGNKRSFDGGSSGGETSGYSTAGSGSNPDSGDNRKEKKGLLSLSALKRRMCADSDRSMGVFKAKEMDEIFRCSQGLLERLVVYLAFSTGLRAGGIARIRLPTNMQAIAYHRGHRIKPVEIDEHMNTIEKYGADRRFRLRQAGRILVADWLNYLRPKVDSPFLFPATRCSDPRKGFEPMATNTLRKVFMDVCARAGVQGSHVHLHTCRHTLIHWMKGEGCTWEDIAQWIGHSDPSITIKAYGKLSMTEKEVGIPDHIIGVSSDDQKGEYRAITRLMGNPWPFTPEQWEGLPLPIQAAPDTGRPRQHDMAAKNARKQGYADTIQRLHKRPRTGGLADPPPGT
jgi:hypothetical protein